MFLGIDTGGTFTDFVYFDTERLHFSKVLSTPDDPTRAIEQGIAGLGLDATRLHLVHGSTVATNAILERKGVKTLLVTNRGLEDVLAIGRQTRAELYNLCPPEKTPWLDAEDCLGVSGRVDAEGSMLQKVDEKDLLRVAAKAADYEAVAVCTLFSFLNPAQEQAIAAALPSHCFVSLSHEVLAEYREFERAAATFLNAYVGPKVARYLAHLSGQLRPRYLFVMHSAGGVMSVHEAGMHAVRMALSGPAGGLVASEHIGTQLERRRLLSFDMGGTSTDVSLMEGRARISTEGRIADLPLAVPALDIHTIGAGGGSIAWRDAAGLLQLGPQSAGADPGPVCYGRGGNEPTVTDANVVLGRIPAHTRMAGALPLDAVAARRALTDMGKTFALSAEEMALGIIRVAEENMAGALRVVSVERGYDPRDFTLVCFGGAGGLHACNLAGMLDIPEIVLPLASGAFSALGMLVGRRQANLSRSQRLPLAEKDAVAMAERIFAGLEADAAARMPGLDLTYERHVDLRYRGQGFHLTLPYRHDAGRMTAAFAKAHQQAYGHVLTQPVEIMTLRLTAFADTPTLRLPEMEATNAPVDSIGHVPVFGCGEVPYYERALLRPGHRIHGPALVLDATATLWLPSPWMLAVSRHGHLLLTRGNKP